MNRLFFYSIMGIGGGTLIGTLLCILWFASTPQKQAQTTNNITTTAQTDLEQTSSYEAFTSITIKDLTLKELEKNKELEVIINAQECKFLQPSDVVECAQVTCTLLDHNVPSAHIKTDKALINRTQKNIFFSGTVRGNIKDVIIQGTDINYNFSQQTLYTTKATSYYHPDFNLNAQKSFIDLKNNFIEMMDGVVNEFTFRND